jgi:hypothetical protein
MKKRACENPARREGVALIIVLAMLTILLALALTLSATTRAERSVVKAHTEMTNTRQLVHAAINRALVDIQLQAGGFSQAQEGSSPSVDVFPVRRMYYVNSLGSAPPPDFAPRVGSSHGRLTELDMRMLLSQESRKFFTYHQDAQDALSHIAGTSNVWIGLHMPGEGPRINNQFTYIAENNSDGIDLNAHFPEWEAGPRLPRNIGQTPLEINWLPMWNAFRLMSGNDTSDADDVENSLHDFLWDDEKGMGRVDTIREINQYLGGVEFLDLEANELHKLSLFCTFSYTPEASYYLQNNQLLAKVDLSGDPGNWVAAADIKAAFQLCHFGNEKLSDVELDTLVACLKDYVDEDLVTDPTRDPTLGSIKSVPMVNEIVTSAELKNVSQSGDTYTYTVDANYAFELWWPFVEQDPQLRSFDLKAKMEITVDVTGKDKDGASVTDSKPKTGDVANKDDIYGLLAKPFTVVTGSVPVTVESSVVLNNSSNLLDKIKVTITYKEIKVMQGGGVVDAVADGIQCAAEKSFSGLPYPAAMAAGTFKAQGVEVVDPRFNYALTQWKRTIAGKVSIGESLSIPQQVNYLTRIHWAANPNLDPNIPPGLDPNDPSAFPRHASQMHCRNGALALVGELGYLPYREWRTLRLLAKDDGVHHHLGEYFMATNDFDQALAEDGLDSFRGKVHVNGSIPALASAFYRLPIESYPGQLSPEPVRFASDDWTQALLFAIELVRLGRPGNGAFASEWDLGSVKAYRSGIFRHPVIFPKTIFPEGLSEFEIESFFRNTMGLLTARNNVFTVMVMVQSLSNLNTPTSTIRAVATVWRDGLPEPTGVPGAVPTHPWFIQNITYLTDYEN